MQKASKYNNYHYNSKLKELAKKNRQTLTKSAACLWKYVLGQKQMLGYQFRRERPILNFIVDFACLELLLVIEVDGITHDSEIAIQKDIHRDEILKSAGFTVLRFSSWAVLNKMEDVSIIITSWISENADNDSLNEIR